jgi:hypothetical protein
VRALAPEDRGQPAARLHAHGVHRLGVAVRGPAVRHVVARVVGQVLVERAAVHHVQELHPAADRQQRQPARLGLAHDRGLEAVHLRPGRPELGVRLGAVHRRVDVGPARDHDAVEARDQLRHHLAGLRRHHHRHAAGAGHGPHVVEVQDHLLAPRLGMGELLVAHGSAHLRGGQSDEGPAG